MVIENVVDSFVDAMKSAITLVDDRTINPQLGHIRLDLFLLSYLSF